MNRLGSLAYGAMLAALLPMSSAESATSASTRCDAPEHRAFDFWIGEWDVTTPASASAIAQSSISRQHDGCVIVEIYRTASGYSGMSMNFYDRRIGQWRQTWIDNFGAAIYFRGGFLSDGSMQMTDESQPDFLKRTTWSLLDDGRVRQQGERSTDGGESWFTVFDGYYRRR